jgi:hypothetical protein
MTALLLALFHRLVHQLAGSPAGTLRKARLKYLLGS